MLGAGVEGMVVRWQLSLDLQESTTLLGCTGAVRGERVHESLELEAGMGGVHPSSRLGL